MTAFFGLAFDFKRWQASIFVRSTGVSHSLKIFKTRSSKSLSWTDSEIPEIPRHSWRECCSFTQHILSIKKSVLKNFAKFTAKNLFSLIKLQVTGTGAFLWIWEHLFLQNTSFGCFCTKISCCKLSDFFLDVATNSKHDPKKWSFSLRISSVNVTNP